MTRKTLALIGLFVAAIATLSCCAMFNAPKEPVKANLNAWIDKDYEEAFSYFAPELKEAVPLEVFTQHVDHVRFKSYKINSISISGDNGTAVVKGKVALVDGGSWGLQYDLVKRGEDWLIWGYEISNQVLFDTD